jgi:hypothetical protein
MYIEGRWEFVNSLSDISRIIREHYNYELADKMDELIDLIPDANYLEDPEGEEFYGKWRLEELEEVIEKIRRLVL